MDLKEFHFACPFWLWGLLLIPAAGWIVFLFYEKNRPAHRLETFIDADLLPYLLVNSSHKKRSFRKTFLLWATVWSCLTIALAGPTWDFRETETFSRDQSLVVVLDLSESMNATDVKPSRLIRAKQKIEDLINLSEGVKIGLVAFAADPHMMAPITEDKETIRHLLPSLDTDLVYVQGSRLSVALDMASTMLEAEPGNNKAVLVISDGGLEDADATTSAKKLSEKGLVVHTMGIGSLEGALLKDVQGNVVKKNGVPILSRLEKETLREVGKAGRGRYFEANYSDRAEFDLLKDLGEKAENQLNVGKKNRFWNERFYIPVFLILPIVLYWFGRGYVFAFLIVFSLPLFTIEAGQASDYFKNSEELAKEALDKEDYETAAERFKDPYRAGIAYYKSGRFAEAEQMFLRSSREEVSSSATYNLGNALAQQQKFKQAVAAYEKVLQRSPDHVKAQENLELVKNLLQEQEQQKSSSQDSSDESESSEESDGKKQQNQEETKEGQEHEKKEDSSDKNEANPEESATEKPENEQQTASQEDQDADIRLNQIANDPKEFLKNKFYIESKKNGTTKGVDPW